MREICFENDQLLLEYHAAGRMLKEREAHLQAVLKTGTVAELKLAMVQNKEGLWLKVGAGSMVPSGSYGE